MGARAAGAASSRILVPRHHASSRRSVLVLHLAHRDMVRPGGRWDLGCVWSRHCAFPRRHTDVLRPPTAALCLDGSGTPMAVYRRIHHCRTSAAAGAMTEGNAALPLADLRILVSSCTSGCDRSGSSAVVRPHVIWAGSIDGSRHVSVQCFLPLHDFPAADEVDEGRCKDDGRLGIRLAARLVVILPTMPIRMTTPDGLHHAQNCRS